MSPEMSGGEHSTDLPPSLRLELFFTHTNTMSEYTDPGSTGNGSTGGSSAGIDLSEVGALNNGVPQETQKQPQVAQEQQPVEQKAEEKPTEGVSEKDERHFSKKINEMNESRFSLAKRLVEVNSDAIYDLAEEDPKIAERLLKEYELGADSIEELLEKKKDPDAEETVIKKRVEDNARMSKVEEELFNEKLSRLKGQHKDLDDELAAEFKKMYSNSAFSGKSEEQLLNIARASLGKTQTQKQDTSALEILRAQEGFFSTPKHTGELKKKQRIPEDKKRLYQKGGVTEADLEKYNIE